MRPVLVCTPCPGSLCLNYVRSVLRLPKEVDFCFGKNESAITRARNHMVGYFMNGDWERLFFIDSDIGFTLEEFARVADSPYSVTAASYAKKGDGEGRTPSDDAIGEPKENGFAVTREAPTGFMCIKRFVFQIMRDCGFSQHQIFDNMIEGDDYLTEDYAFCRRWQKLGGTIHLDTTARLTHQGLKLYV